jgi:hypothetical protein
MVESDRQAVYDDTLRDDLPTDRLD